MPVTINQGGLQWTAGIDTSHLNGQVKDIEKHIGKITDAVEKQNKAIEDLARKAAAGISAYLSFDAATNFIGQMVKVRGEFQQLEVAFTTMLGSKERADKLLADVTQFAATTPFELQEVAKATKQLLAFGIQAESIESTLRSLGDVSAGIGAPLGEIAYLYGTIKTQGVALTQDVRQFAQRGIPVYEELAKVLKVSTEEVGNLISAGKVGFPEIQKVFENLTSEGSKFGGLMEAQSKTISGQLSNLRDSVEQLFNELGKSNEGVITDVISGLSFLVDNFQTILDIVKLLVIAYGSYKAAVIAVTIAQRVQQEMLLQQALAGTKLNTVQALSAVITVNLQRAWKSLNLTMKANPIGLVVAAITTLVAAMLIFNRTSSAAKKAQQDLNKIKSETESVVRKEKDAIQALVKVASDEANSLERRKEAIKQLNQISPQYLGNLTLENVKKQEGIDIINKYIKALEREARAKASQKYLQEIEDERLAAEVEYLEKRQKRLDQFGDPTQQGYDVLVNNDPFIKNLKKRFDAEIDFIDERSKIIKDRIEQDITETDKSTEAKKRTLAVIDEEIKAEKERQQNFSSTSKEYQQYQKKINALEEERRKITGASASEIKAGLKAEDQRNAMLEKRLALLEQIAEIERNARQTGLTDQERQIDEINQRYDQQIQQVRELQREIERFNKRTKGAPIIPVGPSEIDRINAARNLELQNRQYREDAKLYVDNLKSKESAFDKFQQAVIDGNTLLAEKITSTYKEDFGGFETYIDFLKDRIDTIGNLVESGTADFGDRVKLEETLKLLADAQKKADDQQRELQLTNFSNMLKELETFNQRRAAIIKKYSGLEAELEKAKSVFSTEEYAARLKALKDGRTQELTDLDNFLLRQSDLYKNLNQDIIGFTRKRIKDEIKELEKILKASENLTPQMKADVQSWIDQLKGILETTSEIVTNYSKLSEDLQGIAGAFGDLGDGLEGVNDDLAAVLQTLSEIVSVGANAAAAVAKFAAGDYVGAAASAVTAIVGVFSIGKRARESRRKAMEEMLAFQQKVLLGELDINKIYRERAVEQARLNELKLDGLKAEQEALRKNRQQVESDYARIVKLIQSESYVASQSTRKRGGFLGIGRQTVVDNNLASLAGMNYSQLEKLFLEGKLTDKAKELFEALRQLKQEGLDIDQQLNDLKEQAQELLTGTTANTLAQNIAEGFKQGKRSIADFAGDFQTYMRDALIQALQYKYLEGPIQQLFDQFAEATQSGDQLTKEEIDRLQAVYNEIINNAASQFEQLQNIAGLNFSGSAVGSSLAGAIRGMTEQQAELLAGQFGGLRLVAIDQLRVIQAQLSTQQKIETNTSRLHNIEAVLKRLENNGIKVL